MLPESAWRGLLRADERERALRVVRDIAQRLRTLHPGELNPSLFDGSAGIALALAHVSRVTGDDGSAADDFLASAYDTLGADPATVGVSFAAGACGIGWVGAHFDRLAGLAPTGDMDNLVLPLLAEWDGPWELLYGLVGIGVYALEAGGACLEPVLARLAEVPDVDGVWVTDTLTLFGPTSQRPPQYIDLGLAHGVAGVLALTGAAALEGHGRARALAASAAQCLLAHEFPPASRDSRFPATIEPGEDPTPTQIAWCYGDAGAALALAAAAATDPIIGAAMSRATAAAAARSYETSGVEGLGLCHGTAGVAHTMGRLACYDGSVEPVAREWAVRLLHEAESGQLPDAPGVLTGQAGIALALLAAASDVDPIWDRAFLLSTPDAQRPDDTHRPEERTASIVGRS